MSFKEHIHDKINKAYAMLGLIKQNFTHLTTSSFILLYYYIILYYMVSSHLEYCNSVWSPCRKSDIEALEKLQKTATKILPHLKHLKYSEHLSVCKLQTLHYRRIRGDMIEMFKILTGKYESNPNYAWGKFFCNKGPQLEVK